MLVCDAVGTVHRAVMAVTLLGLSIMSQRDTTHYVPGAEEKKGRYRRVPLVTAGCLSLTPVRTLRFQLPGGFCCCPPS